MNRALFLAMATTLLVPAAAHAKTLGLDTSNNLSVNTQNALTQNLTQQDILETQQALNQRGFYKGHIDGRWSPTTAQAVRRFQMQNNLPQSGRLDSSTLDQLGIELSMQQNTDSSVNGNATTRRSNATGTTSSDNTTGSMTPTGNTNNNASGGLRANNSTRTNTTGSMGTTGSTGSMGTTQ